MEGSGNIKKRLKVGLNAYIIVKRKNLSNIDLFTEGLSGCVAVVVANDTYVYMAHVFGQSYDIEERAEKYLRAVFDWMQKNGNGQIQVGLVANGLKAPTIEGFRKACTSLKEKFNLNIKDSKSATSCKVNFVKEQMDLSIDFKKGEKVEKGEKPKWIYMSSKDNSNDTLKPETHGFGDSIEHGSSSEEEEKEGFISNLSLQIKSELEKKEAFSKMQKPDWSKYPKEWKNSPALHKAVETLYESAGSDGSTNYILRIVDKKAKKASKELSEKNRIEICKKLGALLKTPESSQLLESMIGEYLQDVETLTQEKPLKEKPLEENTFSDMPPISSEELYVPPMFRGESKEKEQENDGKTSNEPSVNSCEPKSI